MSRSASAPAAGTAVLIDANLLLLLVVGTVDREEVARFKRTRKYAATDFDLLAAVLSRFRSVWVTPHVLTEVSNLAGQLQSNLRALAYEILARLTQDFTERIDPSADVVSEPLFRRLGLTDAAIMRGARESVTVLTDDLDLYVALSNAGAQVINFTYVRTGAWAV